MKFHGLVLLVALCCFGGNAQITFYATNLPGQVGQFSRTYISTGTDASNLIGQPGGPRLWDFSQPQQPGETSRRMDVVPPTDGGHGSSFPSASFAERYTDEPNGNQSWDYYSVTPNLGRTFFGHYDSSVGSASPFSPPAIDIPNSVGLGTNWSYAGNAGVGIVTFHLAVSATADAYGTLVLPQIGVVPALRVNQFNTEQIYYNGSPISTQYFREYYWLVPGIGKALHIVSDYTSDPASINFTSVNEVRRAFEVRPWRVANLNLRRQGNTVILNWRQESNTSGYRVEFLGNLQSNNWQFLAAPPTNGWPDGSVVTQGQRFYRVIVEP